MKLEDLCEIIVETIPVPDHSTLLMRLDSTKMHRNFGYKSEWNKLARIMKALKRNHDIDVFTVPANMFDVVYAGPKMPYDKLMEKIDTLESGVPITKVSDLKGANSDEQTNQEEETTSQD